MRDLKIYDYVRLIGSRSIIYSLLVLSTAYKSSSAADHYSDSLIGVIDSMEESKRPPVILKLAFHYLKENGVCNHLP
jgi:hypothetical protein